ncbi:hypothetical protein [Polaribacter sp.]|uniref:hypothetical protein n=1 Tax=Polaribacter sp. TaxID=1920175 RepID=UPI004047F956
MEDSNNWIDEAFRSVQHQKQPRLNADLFLKIEQRINNESTKVLLMPIWKVAVASAVILAINLVILKDVIHIKQNRVVKEYQLGTNYNFYANE